MSSTCSRLLSNTSLSWGPGGWGEILKVALEQKVLYNVMGPQSIVISHLPLITFSEPGLLLDARCLRVAWRDWGGPRCSDIIRHTHMVLRCQEKQLVNYYHHFSDWKQVRSFSGFPLAFGNVPGSEGRWSGCPWGELGKMCASWVGWHFCPRGQLWCPSYTGHLVCNV